MAKERKLEGEEVFAGNITTRASIATMFNSMRPSITLDSITARVSQVYNDRKTDLALAIYQKKLNLVKKLLEEGADANETDKHGSTALMKAAFAGNTEIVNLLLENGAAKSINASTYNSGCTVLMDAITFSQNTDILNLLLKNGADVNAIDGIGTALTRSISCRHKEGTKILLDHNLNYSSFQKLVKTINSLETFNQKFHKLDLDIKLSIIDSIDRYLDSLDVEMKNDLAEINSITLDKRENYTNKKKVLLELIDIIKSDIPDTDEEKVADIEEIRSELVELFDNSINKLDHEFADNFAYYIGISNSFNPEIDALPNGLPEELQSLIGKYVLWNLLNPETEQKEEGLTDSVLQGLMDEEAMSAEYHMS